ncbi:MAG: M35 family metallo-endopeptidase [Bacteriovoracia bacterium]
MRGFTFLFLFFTVSAAAGETRIVQCSTTQAGQLRVAAKTVLEKSRTLVPPAADISKYSMEYVQKNYIEAKGRVPRWFAGDPSRTERAYTDYLAGMQRVLSAMNRDAEAGYELRCVTNSDRQCSDGDTMAYVYYIAGHRLPRIYVCPLFFNNSPTSQASTIFHELSHYAADTDHGDFSKPASLEQLRTSYMDAYHIEPLMYRSLEKHMEFMWAQMWIPPRNPPGFDSDEFGYWY